MKHFCFSCALLAALVPFGTPRAAAPAIPKAHVDELLTQLDDDDFFVRHKADKELRALGRGVVPRLLAERVTTPSLEVRHRIDKMTESLTPVERLNGWARLLSHPDRRCRDKADEALRQACPAALPALLKMKGTLDEQCRVRLDKMIEEMAETAY